MRISDYKSFCEARLGDLLNIKGATASEFAKSIKTAAEKKFNIKEKLPRFIKLENGSVVEFDWYDTASHNLIKRIADRTGFVSVEDFVDCIKFELSSVFPDMIGKELYNTGRYTLYLEEYNISLIVEFDLNRNMGKNFFISVITILGGRRGEEVEEIIDVKSSKT